MKITTLITELPAANVKQMATGLRTKYSTLTKPQAKAIATHIIEYKGKAKSKHPESTLQTVVDSIQESCTSAGLKLTITMP